MNAILASTLVAKSVTTDDRYRSHCLLVWELEAGRAAMAKPFFEVRAMLRVACLPGDVNGGRIQVSYHGQR